MPVGARLLWPMKITVEPTPAEDLEFDPDLREPVETEEEVRIKAIDSRFTIPAQVRFSSSLQSSMKFTGDDGDTRARAIIKKRSQRKYGVQSNWRIVQLVERDGTVQEVNLRITEVRPSAQKGTFNLYILFFEDIGKA